jgi:hypothetical protein
MMSEQTRSRTKALNDLIERESLEEITPEQATSSKYLGSLVTKVVFKNENRTYYRTPHRSIVDSSMDRVRRLIKGAKKKYGHRGDLKFLSYLSAPFERDYDPHGGRSSGTYRPSCAYNHYAFVINIFQGDKTK